MRNTATGFKLGAVALVLLIFTAMIIVVFGQIRFERTTGYSAIFSSASGLRNGQFVRASGVEVGKVSKIHIIDAGQRIRVDFTVDSALPLYRGTFASIRYLNLIGDRYLELKRGDDDRPLEAGSVIPIEHTQPALDLDALIGAFRPLFRALDPQKVNTITSSILTVFQDQGGTINDILDQTAQLTATLADRSVEIGEVINNLNTVLDTTIAHQTQFNDTINNVEQLVTALKGRADPIADSVANISNAASTVADLLSENRPLVRRTLTGVETVQQPLVDQGAEVNAIFVQLPSALKLIGRAGGIYGDFFNFYACDISLMVNGLQPGGPTRTVKLTTQPTGRCTPQ